MTRVPGRSYVVGGAVRDRLLGLPVVDRDHVVVGATVESMKAAGFKPVGRDFPVFLHPGTHEEYALARTERKVAAGYAGFVFHADPAVTLEEDLARRDLTINAMAEDEADGVLVDPFGGQRDLAARVFRHVGPAFGEDPVRVLRLARFAARFVDFTIAPETLALAQAMAAAGEIDALVPERVWQEWSRGLMEKSPVRLFDVLRATHALSRLAPGLADDARWPRTAAGLTRAAAAGASLEVRFAIVMQALDDAPRVDAIERWCERFAVPRAARDLAVLVAREAEPLRSALRETGPRRAAALVAVCERADAARRRARFRDGVAAIASLIGDDAERGDFERQVAAVLVAFDGIDTAAIVAAASGPAAIAAGLRSAREAAILRAP